MTPHPLIPSGGNFWPQRPSPSIKIPYAWEGIYGARKQERFRPLLAHSPYPTVTFIASSLPGPFHYLPGPGDAYSSLGPTRRSLPLSAMGEGARVIPAAPRHWPLRIKDSLPLGPYHAFMAGVCVCMGVVSTRETGRNHAYTRLPTHKRFLTLGGVSGCGRIKDSGRSTPYHPANAPLRSWGPTDA